MIAGSASLSDFAGSFTPNTGSVVVCSCAGSTTKEVGRTATPIAIAGARPIKQKKASHIVLDKQRSCKVRTM
jgi:hypothetical protein